MVERNAVLDTLLAALADPTRRALYERLVTHGESDVSGLAAAHRDITLQAVSKHLRVLERAGLISRRRSGRRSFCRADPARLIDLVRWMTHVHTFWDVRLGKLEDLLHETSAESMDTLDAPSMPAVRLSRSFHASAETVFAALTTPALVARWFAPTAEYHVDIDVYNAVPGGAYRLHMRHQNGNVHTVAGTFEEVVSPHRLAFSFAWEGDGAMAQMPPTRVTMVVAAEEAGRSTLTITHEGLPNAEAAASHEEGWAGTLFRLQGAVELPTTLHHVAPVLALHRRLFENAIRDVGADDFARRINDRTNSMQWVAGHLAYSRMQIAQLLGHVPTEGSPLEAFAATISEDTDYPDAAEILTGFVAAGAAVHRVLPDVTPEMLAGPSPLPLPINDPTLAGAITFFIDHESYHIGQLGFLRKAVGYDAMSYD